VDQLAAKTVLFGLESILELKAMKVDWSIKLVEDWANRNMHFRKHKSKRMDGLFISTMTVHERGKKKVWRDQWVLSGFYSGSDSSESLHLPSLNIWCEVVNINEENNS
jgi:hypothetical protein